MGLTPDVQCEAWRRIAAWRLETTAPVACPVCEAMGLEVEDRSARPHAEWYAISCAGCGLDETLHMPMASLNPNWDV